MGCLMFAVVILFLSDVYLYMARMTIKFSPLHSTYSFHHCNKNNQPTKQSNFMDPQTPLKNRSTTEKKMKHHQVH